MTPAQIERARREHYDRLIAPARERYQTILREAYEDYVAEVAELARIYAEAKERSLLAHDTRWKPARLEFEAACASAGTEAARLAGGVE